MVRPASSVDDATQIRRTGLLPSVDVVALRLHDAAVAPAASRTCANAYCELASSLTLATVWNEPPFCRWRSTTSFGAAA